MATRTLPTGGLVSLFVRHRNAANLVMILMIIFGVFAIGRINTQFLPKVEIPVITVGVAWSGASAEDVEANILEIMEPELRFLDGVDRVTSRAREGTASIGLEYKAEKDLADALREVETAVKAITNLPEDSETPTVRQAARGFDRVARLAVTGDFPESTLRFYAKKIRDDLIDRGIDKVTMVGLRSRELKIDVPEQELRRLDMTVQDISAAIAANSRDLPSGQMEGQMETQLRTVADAESPEALARLEIKSFPTGEKVRLGDITTIRSGYDDSQSQGFVGGKRAIQLTVERADSADTLKTARLLLSYVDEIKDQLPPGLELAVYDIRADALTQRIMVLVKNGLGGLLLVVLILFVFLNARIAFWVAAGIPVAMLATIGIMYVTGQTINMLTLFALIMMLGVIVDDAIVVGEHTATRFAQGDGPYEAAENGAGRMVVPVTAAMITTIAAFAPVLVITGVIGQIVSVLPYVVIAVILASLIECFLILPGHLAHTLQPRQYKRWSYWRQFTIALVVAAFGVSISGDNAGGWFVEVSKGVMQLIRDYLPLPIIPGSAQGLVDAAQSWRADVSFPVFMLALAVIAYTLSVLVEAVASAFGAWRRRGRTEDQMMEEGAFRKGFDRQFERFKEGPFNWFTRLTYRYRYITIAVAISTFLIGAIGMMAGDKVGFVFFPTAEAENINARVVFNAGVPEEKAVDAIKRIEDALRTAEKSLSDDGEVLVTAAFSTYGEAGRSVGDNLASIRVQLTSSEVRTVRTPEIVRAWRQAIPKIAGVRRVAVFESRGGPPGRDIDIQLRGENAATLKRVATEIIPIVETVNAISGVADDLPYGKPELVMEMTPRGTALGFSIDAVGRQLRNAFEGAIPRRFADGDDEITVRITKVMRTKGVAALRNFELKSPAGEFVPLSEVVTITERQGFAAIERIDGRATVSVTADLNTDINTTEKAIEYLEQSAMPSIISQAGVDYRYSGRDEERKEAFADLQIGVVIALSVIYIILAWVFASYWRPISVMAIIPFGAVGAVMGHYLWGVPLTIFSMIGLLGLAGILVNDSIILVSRLDERLEEGDTLEEAAIGASRDRLRAVLLTSLTTIGGLVPLLYEKSVQAQFLIPMALTMVFGLAIATLLVLFLVPAIIGVGYDIRGFFSALFGQRRKQSKDDPGLQAAE
ncbi:efflux RND transporter permease subunit [Pseudahrensia aquimaris]|uniref:Efflux RND transporter permease subunit n=1 Tax=Pseudahrensia aquimaris TaxID=744461 RepID=A0ABW3FIM3_9HYPH